MSETFSHPAGSCVTVSSSLLTVPVSGGGWGVQPFPVLSQTLQLTPSPLCRLGLQGQNVLIFGHSTEPFYFRVAEWVNERPCVRFVGVGICCTVSALCSWDGFIFLKNPKLGCTFTSLSFADPFLFIAVSLGIPAVRCSLECHQHHSKSQRAGRHPEHSLLRSRKWRFSLCIAGKLSTSLQLLATTCSPAV